MRPSKWQTIEIRALFRWIEPLLFWTPCAQKPPQRDISYRACALPATASGADESVARVECSSAANAARKHFWNGPLCIGGDLCGEITTKAIVDEKTQHLNSFYSKLMENRNDDVYALSWVISGRKLAGEDQIIIDRYIAIIIVKCRAFETLSQRPWQLGLFRTSARTQKCLLTYWHRTQRRDISVREWRHRASPEVVMTS